MAKLLAVFAIVMLLCSPVAAEPLLSFPPGKQIQNRRAFTLDEMKVLLKIYTDYKSFGGQIPLYQGQLQSLSSLTLNQEKQINLLGTELTTLQKELDRKHQMWVEENKKRHEAENRPQFGSWVAWGIAGVATVAAAVLTGVLVANAK